MSANIQKTVYLKFWQQINPLNEQYIKTSKILLWIQMLIKYEKELLKKLNPKSSQNSKIQKGAQKLNNKVNAPNKRQNSKNTKESDHNSRKEPQEAKQIKNQQNKEQKKPDSIQKPQITQEVILSYIKNYVQTDQYKLLKMHLQQLTPSELSKEVKHHNSPEKISPKKPLKKPSQNTLPSKYDESLIYLSFQESLFFYYWFRKMYEKDQKDRFVQKIRRQQQILDQKTIKQEQSPQKEKQGSQLLQNVYQPKYLTQLTKRQMSYLNEQSFISLKQHEPKLEILFRHYSKYSHALTKQIFSFEQRHALGQMMNLHQWMVFCKQWSILNAKNINEGWEVGKVTKQFLMDVYYRNSINRKEMSFEMFERALIGVANRMFQECDIYKAKPIDILLIFLSIKNEQIFVQNLETKKISYRQGEILNCFKGKNREVYEKMKIVRVRGVEKLRRSEADVLQQKQSRTDYWVRTKGQGQDRAQRYSVRLQNKQSSENFGNNFSNMGIEIPKEQRGGLSRNLINSNHRKSAPEIGVKLPSISSNKFFQKIPQNNHLNKFKEYMQKEMPESSSVLSNKITGYHTIHSLHLQADHQKLALNNKVEHEKINKLIGSKLNHLFQGNLPLLPHQKISILEDANNQFPKKINISQQTQFKGEPGYDTSEGTIEKIMNPESPNN